MKNDKKQWFSESDLLELCDELDIEVSKNSGCPTLQGVELTPDLISKILSEPSGPELL